MQPNTPSQAHEWMVKNAAALDGKVDRYYRWNLSLFKMDKGRKILDIGCGNGFYFDEIVRFEPATYTGIDYSAEYVDQIRKKFNGRTGFHAHVADLQKTDLSTLLGNERFDYIFCFDVLEHIEHDRALLMQISAYMQKSGTARFFIRVPALQSIYGSNDAAIGHYRRYSRPALAKLLGDCGFTIKKIKYQNFPGILPWFITGRILKKKQAVTEKQGRLFNTIVPIIESVENVVPPPAGLSVYAVCERKV